MSCTPSNKAHAVSTKRKDGSLRVSVTCKANPDEGKTEQSHQKECDIRNIVRRYAKMGVPLNQMPDPATYRDLTERPDYLSANIIVAKANAAFADLPARIRARFQNEPGVFMEFMADPSNYDEGVKLGLFKEKPVAPPPNAPEVPPKPAKHPKKPHHPKGDEGQPEGGSDQ